METRRSIYVLSKQAKTMALIKSMQVYPCLYCSDRHKTAGFLVKRLKYFLFPCTFDSFENGYLGFLY